jgi:hypothetical protein
MDNRLIAEIKKREIPLPFFRAEKSNTIYES